MPFIQTDNGIIIKSAGKYNISGAVNGIRMSACANEPTTELLQFCISPGFPGYGWDNLCGFCSMRIAAANYSASIYIGAEELHIADKYCITINMVSQIEIGNKNVPEGTECTIDLKQGAQINVVKLPSTYTLNLICFL